MFELIEGMESISSKTAPYLPPMWECETSFSNSISFPQNIF